MENYLDLKNNVNFEKLKIPAEIIKKGGIVVFPTETVYGIGTNGLDSKAIEKLYIVKRRPFNKPISLLVSNMKMVEYLAEDITELEYKLMEKFFPGPFTIVLKSRKIVPNILTANTNTVGIRMPNATITQKLIEYANVPIAAPSANISGKKSGTNMQDIMKDFEDNVDYFIDNGKSPIGDSSTVVKVINGNIHILRQGNIREEQIKL